jgi:glycogen(starch) synthase
MHIAFVEAGYPHPHGGGGAGTYVQTVGRELVRRGHEVTVVSSWCPRCPFFLEDEGVSIYRPPLSSSLHWYISKVPGLKVGALAVRYLEHGWRLYRFLADLHGTKSIDVVEFSEGGDFWDAIRPTFPFLVHLHGSRYTFLRMSGRPTGQADWFHRRLELLFVRQALWVVSPSWALLDLVTGELGEPLKRTVVIPYPLDPELMQGDRPRVSIESDVKTVLFAARNDPVKGGEVLLRAIPLVRSKLPKVEFRLFGYKPRGETSVPEGTQCYAFVPREELRKYYYEADLCVVPSLADNSPYVVYEAMAAGLPVVASRVGGIPELVEDGVTGLLVPPNDPESLAEAVIELLRDDVRRKEMGQRGRERIIRLANLKENVDRRVAIYQRIIQEWWGI